MNNLQWRSESGRDLELAAWHNGGRPIPSPPVAKQALVRDYAERWALDTLIETGTYLGEMGLATNDLFARIYTIELSDMLYEQAVRIFDRHPNVTCVHGDSAVELPALLEATTTRALLWLDGHWSEGVTALGDKETPIVAELTAALARPERHVILIDDARCFADGAEPHPDYPTIAWVESTARGHGYRFELADDVMRLEPVLARPSFSVLMPTSNREQFLPRAIDAVLAQQADVQLVVKNGGRGVRHLVPIDPRLVLIEAVDSGIPDAVNQALARAEGDILHWANDDDVMEPDALEFVATWLNDAEWGYGRMRMVDADGHETGAAGGGTWDLGRQLRTNGIPQPATYWRRGLVAEFDVAVGACCDWAAWNDLGLRHPPRITDRILAAYTTHPDSFSVVHAGELRRSAVKVRRAYRARAARLRPSR